MSLEFTTYEEYKKYATKYSFEEANEKLNNMLSDKFGKNVSYDCIYCAFSALSDKGYISDEELRKTHDKYIEKKKNKIYKDMGITIKKN